MTTLFVLVIVIGGFYGLKRMAGNAVRFGAEHPTAVRVGGHLLKRMLTRR
jgi:hypothetical protein